MKEYHWLITSAMEHVVKTARGPALPLAKGMMEQIPQFISAGMPIELALRESLLLAIHSAQVKARHSVGTERFVFEDFISSCRKIEAETMHLISV
jgi:hypothetical protein